MRDSDFSFYRFYVRQDNGKAYNAYKMMKFLQALRMEMTDWVYDISKHVLIPGAVARSEACPLGMQADRVRYIRLAHSFVETWSWKKNLRPFYLFRWFKKSSCQLLAKECTLSTGKLPRRLAQEQCGWGNWPRLKWHKMCWRAVKQNQTKISLIVTDVGWPSLTCECEKLFHTM